MKGPRPKGLKSNNKMYADMLLQANKDKDFVKRIIDPTTIPSLDRGNGSTSTHSMRHDVDANGQWYVYPSVVNKNGTLVDMKDKAFDNALNTGEYIKVNDPKLAAWMSTGGYKETDTAHQSFKNGGNMKKKIYIKPENRGKFNATKKRTGKTTEELTHSKNPLTRKRAIFAQNAAKWKHALGGFLEQTDHQLFKNGGDMKKRKLTPKGVKMMLQMMEHGGEIDSTGFSNFMNSEGMNKANAVLPIVQKSIEGVVQAIETGKQGVRNENTQFGLMSEDTNPFMKFGGKLKEFFGPSHEQGGIPVDADLNVTSNGPDAEVEGGETGINFGMGDSYIFSDSLFDKNGKTFAENSKKMEKDFGRNDQISKRTKDKSLTNLSKRNEAAKAQMQLDGFMKKYGGGIKKYILGGDPNDPLTGGFTGSTFTGNKPYNPLEDATSGVDPMELNFDFQGTTQRKNADPMVAGDYANAYETLPSSTLPIQPLKPLTPRDPGLLTPPDRKLPLLTDPLSGSPASEGEGDMDLNSVARAMKSAGLAQSFMDAIMPAEQEKLELNRNKDEVEQLMESRRIDMTPIMNRILGQRNVGMENARQAGSFNTQAVLANQAIDAAGKNLSDAELQQQQMDNQYAGEEAGVKQQLGSEAKQDRVVKNEKQQMNEASARNMTRDFVGNVTKFANDYNKREYVKKEIANNKDIAELTIKQGMTILGMKYKDFGLSDEFMEKMRSGNYSIDDLIKFIGAVDKAQ